MGNLDFLEKKPRIAYTLSWDGVTEGKVTNTKGSRTVYKISSEEFIPRPDIVWTPTGLTGLPCSTPKNIRLERNYRFPNIEGESNVSVSVLKEDTSKAGYYKFVLMFGDNDTGNNGLDLFYVIVANKEIISAEFGNINPTFPEIGWYVDDNTNIEAGDIMSILKDPLVQFSYSGKGFTSPQKPYRYVSRFVKPDDDVCIWINTARIPKTDEEKSKGYNSICKPEDFNSEADIKLNEDLAFLFHCSDIMIVNEVQQYGNNSNTNIMKYGFNVMLQIGYAEGLHISNGGEDIFFDPNISEDDYYNWRDKYFKNPRP